MKYITAVLLIIVLSGCASTGTSTTWKHPGISDPVQENRQLTIDDGYCTAVAASGSETIDTRAPLPSYYGRTFTGTVDTYGPSGYTRSAITGTVAPNDSFSSYYAATRSIGAGLAARRVREKLYRSCMMQRGWYEGETPDSSELDGERKMIGVSSLSQNPMR